MSRKRTCNDQFHGLIPGVDRAMIGDLTPSQCEARHIREDSAVAEQWRGGEAAEIDRSAFSFALRLDRNAVTFASAGAVNPKPCGRPSWRS